MEKRVEALRNMYEDAEKTVRTRIKNLLKEKGLTENSVAAGDGAAQSRLNSQLKDGRITLNTILHILEACPDVSADWLLRGTGEIHRTPDGVNVGDNSIGGVGTFKNINAGDAINRLISLTEEKDKQIDKLLQIISNISK